MGKLQRKITAFTEPVNANSSLVGLPVPTGEKEILKYDYDESFDHPLFVAMAISLQERKKKR
jgi:hypothetical protein